MSLISSDYKLYAHHSRGSLYCFAKMIFSGCATDDEVKAPPVNRPHAHNGCIGEPLPRHHTPFPRATGALTSDSEAPRGRREPGMGWPGWQRVATTATDKRVLETLFSDLEPSQRAGKLTYLPQQRDVKKNEKERGKKKPAPTPTVPQSFERKLACMGAAQIRAQLGRMKQLFLLRPRPHQRGMGF